MAQASIFQSLVGKVWPSLQKVIDKVNEKRNGQSKLTYLHKTMLRKEYSPDQKWESGSVNTNYVSADMVAMDSPLPLKSRPSMAYSSGRLPKVGLLRVLEESKLNAIDIMQKQGKSWKDIAAKLTDDAVFCSTAIDEENERAFLEALSNGLVCYPSEQTDDAGNRQLIRFNFGYLPENTYSSSVKDVVDLDDVEHVIDEAAENGDTIATIALDKTAYDQLRKSAKGKKLVADYESRVYTDPSLLPVPTRSKFDEAFKDQFGIDFLVTDRVIRKETNGVIKKIRPWNPSRLIFLTTSPSEQVGAFVWGTLAEENHKAKQVDYTTVDGFKLISKFSETNPLREYTGGQALCLPVIENVDQIYILDTSEAAEVNEEAEEADTTDVTVTWGDNTYTKSDFISVLKSMGVRIAVNASDATVIKKINSLSDAEREQLAILAEEYIVTPEGDDEEEVVLGT